MHAKTAGLVFTPALLSVFSILLLAPVASAGFVSVNVDAVGNANPPSSGPPEHVWGLMPDGKNAWLVLSELFDVPDFTDSFDVSVTGITNADPVLSITKVIQNTTGVTWVGFNIDLDPQETATFVGTPTSDKMTLINQTATSLDFGLPSPVASGESVSFTFDINIPSTGPFGFTLRQSPVLIPEPATIAFAGMGLLAASFVTRRQRR